MNKFFSKTSDEILKSFNVTKEGLNDAQVAENIKHYGYNELTEKKENLSFKYF